MVVNVISIVDPAYLFNYKLTAALPLILYKILFAELVFKTYSTVFP